MEILIVAVAAFVGGCVVTALYGSKAKTALKSENAALKNSLKNLANRV